MSKNVYANGNEISAKRNDNKSMAAMADVCLSPPSPPAGPIPIPYPNTSDASKTDGGSKTVKVGGSEAGLKNKSTYKDSNGDEAATKSLGMGVVTHTIQGKTQFSAWSMDVLIEGENAIRHMDMTTHNHMNPPNMAMTLSQGGQNTLSGDKTCAELEAENEAARGTAAKPGDLAPRAQKPETAFTSTTAVFTPGDGSGSVSMKAVTPRDLVKRSKQSGYAKSRPANQTRACTSGSAGGQMNANHTEPKIAEQIFDAAKAAGISMPTAPGALGTLKMNIHHKPANKAADNDPCPSCEKEICTAIACGVTVKLCENGTEKDPDFC